MTIKYIGLRCTDDSFPALESAVSQNRHTIEWVGKEEELMSRVGNVDGVIAFLQANINYDVYNVCRQLALLPNVVSVILLVDDKNFEDMQKAMHAGASDLLCSSDSDDTFRAAIERADSVLTSRLSRIPISSDLSDNTSAHKGKVLTVCSARGGLGKSTLTANLAIAMAKESLRVAVVDLNLQYGDIAVLFDMTPKRTLYEWVKGAQSATEALSSVKLTYNRSVDVYPAPLRPEFAEAVTGQHINILLHALRPKYDMVLIDTASYLDDTQICALESADEVIVLTSLDLPTLKNTKLLMETVESLQLKAHLNVVVNKELKKSSVSVDQVPSILGHPVVHRIPYDERTVLDSINGGTPYIEAVPRSRAAKAVLALASMLCSKNRLVDMRLRKSEHHSHKTHGRRKA